MTSAISMSTALWPVTRISASSGGCAARMACTRSCASFDPARSGVETASTMRRSLAVWATASRMKTGSISGLAAKICR